MKQTILNTISDTYNLKTKKAMNTIIEKNLTFSQALEHLKLGGKIKVPEWTGYWFLRGGKIWVKTFDGKYLDTPWLQETVLREDWQLIEVEVNILEHEQY